MKNVTLLTYVTLIAFLFTACEQNSPLSTILPSDGETEESSTLIEPNQSRNVYTKKYDTGSNTDVSMWNTTVVEVHNGNGSNDNNIYYRVGIRNGSSSISWGSSRKHTTGRNPSIAVYNNRVVEIHRGSNSRNYYYRVGTVNTSTKTISWGTSTQYTTGDAQLSVGLYGSTVVEAHRGSGGIYYKVGTVNWTTKKISWGSAVNMGINTTSDSDVSIDIDSRGVMLAYTRSEDVYLKSGYANTSTKRISWVKSSSDLFSSRDFEDIDIDMDGSYYYIVLRDGNGYGYNDLVFGSGTFDNYTYYPGSSGYIFTTGSMGACTADGGYWVETHPGTSNGNLYYSIWE